MYLRYIVPVLYNSRLDISRISEYKLVGRQAAPARSAPRRPQIADSSASSRTVPGCLKARWVCAWLSTVRRMAPTGSPRVILLPLVLLALVMSAVSPTIVPRPEPAAASVADAEQLEGTEASASVPTPATAGSKPAEAEAPPPAPAPPRSAVCDAKHCDGCATTVECAAVKECVWHPHEHYCHVSQRASTRLPLERAVCVQNLCGYLH